MFFLDCSAIHEGLLPRLNDIYQELITFVADEAKNLAANFVDEMKVIAKVRMCVRFVEGKLDADEDHCRGKKMFN